MVIFGLGFLSVDEAMLTENEVTNFRLDFPQETQELIAKLQIKCSPEVQKPLFSKMVYIVIDALRADFVSSIDSSRFGYSMPFIDKLVSDGKAIGIVSEAQTPTVTMPRIKSLMSGTYPSFMDLIYNLNAQKFGDDNIIQQACDRKKRIVFYGDDTWLQMFPESMFIRSNSTSSFFATDYIQVDTNVTENALPELSKLNDWDFMVLHYLGVDHIGHSHGGATSRLMKAKLIEMDQVVRTIHSSLSKSGQPYLFVITGDHGMTDAGNHGGSTREESMTGVVFINTSATNPTANKKLETESLRTQNVVQIDMAVTVSSLLGLPIPNKSKGKPIIPVLDAMEMPIVQKLCHLNANSLHIQKMISSNFSENLNVLTKALDAHSKYLSQKGSEKSLRSLATTAMNHYAEYTEKIQESVMRGKSHKGLWSPLSIGILIGFGSILSLLHLENRREGLSIMSGANVLDPLNLIHVMSVIFHVLCLSSTSFVENESYHWHFMASTLMVLNLFISFKKYQKSDLSRRKAETVASSSSSPSSGHYSGTRVAHNGHHNHTGDIRSRRSAACEGNNSHSDSSPPHDRVIFLDESLQFFLLRLLMFLSILIILRLTNSWSIMNKADVSDYLSDQNKRHITSSLVILTFVSVTFLVPTTKLGKQHCLILSGFFWVYLFR